MSGSGGKIWWDGDPIFEIISFEAKVPIDREDVSFAGELVSDSKMTGWSGEYTIKVRKIFSTAQEKFAEAIKSGRDIRTSIFAALDDPDAYGAERLALYNCWINELPLMNWENKSLGEEEISGGFTNFKFLDTVTRR